MADGEAALARYPFVAVNVSADRADEVSALLFELGATGVEERDDQTLVRGPGEGRVTLVGSFDSHAEAESAIAALERAVEGGAARLEEVVGDAWRDAWKEHFAPFSLTPRIVVAPPWVPRDEIPVGPGQAVLELEPGRAFGTGLHATTALVAELLDARAAAVAGRDVLDVGAGSGILALVALKLGAARAVAVDTDPEAVEVARENAARNGLADRIEVHAGGVERAGRAFPCVLANIEARVLRPLAAAIAAAVAPGGLLVLSGILAHEHDAIVATYEGLAPPEPDAGPLVHVETRRRSTDAGTSRDDWVAIAFERAPPGHARGGEERA